MRFFECYCLIVIMQTDCMYKIFANTLYCRVHKFDVPRLPHLKEFLDEHSKHIMDEPIQVPKGFSYKAMLGRVFTSHR